MSRKFYIYGGVGIVVVIAAVLVFSHRSINVFNGGALIGKEGAQKKGPLTGQSCERAGERPVAIMISSDPEARPLSGISAGDITFEMPVTPSGVTRMMPVFQCDIPKEVGSVRSSRLDFVPLALGLNVIYGHFGGEHSVLEELNNGIIDNIDGLRYDGTIYYRKTNIPRPHNAFTNFDLLAKAISELSYKTANSFSGYPHEKDTKNLGNETPPSIYTNQFTVAWRYDAAANAYFRSRDGRPEIDKNTNQQVSVQNVVITQTTWFAWPPESETNGKLNPNYVRIKTVGGGTATVYKDGQKVVGTWKKTNDKAKLYFYDGQGKEIQFAPGKIWVEFSAQL